MHTRHHHTLLRTALLLFVIVVPLLLTTPTSAAPEKRVLSGVPPTPQLWNLSCEYAATSAATAYYGNRVNQQMLRAEIGTNANPHRGFRGDISGAWGGTTNYGVYAEPIAAALKRHGFAHARVFYGGADTLRAEIAANHPVVVWITGDYSAQKRTVMKDGSGTYSLVPREHAVTAYGYDTAGVWVMDPAVARTSHVAWGTFDRGWAQLDRMALVIAP